MQTRAQWLLLLAACSQPASTTASVSSSPAAVAAAVAAAAPAPHDAHGDEESDDYSVPSAPFSNPEKSFEAVKKALLESYYTGSLTEDDLYRAATAGMLERVDPALRKWNRLLSPADLAELKSDLRGELVGIGVGISLDKATGYIDVTNTFPDSPADRAGIAPPDKIVTVDGKLYKGLTLHEVVADIRGVQGRPVVLSVLRGDKLLTIPVVRERVQLGKVISMVVEGNVGLVRVPSFNATTPAAIHGAIADLASKKVRGLVVDLRENPGGSFDDAVASAGEFFPAGTTVVSLRRRGKVEPVQAKANPTSLDVPVAVLIDHSTASSAELMTAALQDVRHATVVGTRTLGKWTVQSLDDLPNGYAAKFTTALFESPSGRSYEGVGLPPDIEVDFPADSVKRVQGITDPTKRLAEDVPLRTAVALFGH